MKDLVSKETMVLLGLGSETHKFGMKQVVDSVVLFNMQNR